MKHFYVKVLVLQIVFHANAFYQSQFLTSQRYQLYYLSYVVIFFLSISRGH